MAVQEMVDVQIELNSVDLSGRIAGSTLQASGDEPTDLDFIDGSSVPAGGGNIRWNLQLNMTQDYDAGSVYATLYPALGTWVSFAAKPIKTGSPSATAPSFEGQVFVNDLSMFSGDAPNPTSFSVTYKCRNVAPVVA